MLKSRCIYAYVFETPPPEGASIMNMHKYEKIPHPFIIEPPDGSGAKTILPGSLISFNLILIGRAINYLPYFIYTFDELGKIGIGKGRGRYRLKEVKTAKDGIIVYLESDKIIRNVEPDLIEILAFVPSNKIDNITLKFVTPLRMKYNRDLVVIPEFHILIRHLLRRLGLLYYFHCSSSSEPSWNHKEIINHAETIKMISSSLRWFDWERYSSRQKTRMRLGGLVGEITYSGDLKPFIYILKAGEVLHIGKNTSFGLGKYEIK